MPQMAPIGWLSLFLIFSITFIMFNIMNFYSMIPSTPKSLTYSLKSNTPMNWKW